MCHIVFNHVLLMKAEHSTLEIKHFVRDRETRYWSWQLESWVNDGERGGHGLPNSRTTTFRCEARVKYQRSRIDSEKWEPPRSCKEYTSYNRKLATETIQLQHEERHEHWGQAWDKPHQQQVQWHEHEHAQDSQHSEHERKRAPCHTLWCWFTRTSWLKFWVPSCHPCTCASLLEFTSLTLHFDLSFTIFSLFFPLTHLGAAHWARQPDRHAKFAHLREQGE